MRLPDAYLIHASQGRARIQIPSKRHDAAYFDRVGRELIKIPEIVRVQANPLSASVLVEYESLRQAHEATMQAVGAYCMNREMFHLSVEAVGDRVTLLSESIRQRVKGINDGIREGSGGLLDLGSLGFIGLGSFALLQAKRGNLLGPASTVFFQALTALAYSRPDLRPSKKS
ncbi:MAG TPA: hypothetical protein VM532_11125 [Burkholderiales bacterium]|nr:hypothetical protein [Burkholderiales bacterium]